MPSLPFIDRQATRPLLGLGITYPSVSVLDRIGPDWDWILIDAQHGDLDFREAANLVRASIAIGRPAIVRVPSQDPSWIGKIVDAGAAGTIIPMIESIDETNRMVQAAKFPPLGNRSYGGRSVIDHLGRGYYKSANRDTVLILQPESIGAVGLAEDMVKLPGVDGLFLGPEDMLIRDGKDVDTPKNDATIGKACQTVADACRKHGKLCMGHGVNGPTIEMAIKYRYALVIGGADVGFLTAGSKESSQALRKSLTPAASAESGDTKKSCALY